MDKKFKNVVAWFQKHLTWIKLFFIGFILLFVLSQVLKIASDINYQDLKNNLFSQSPLAIIVMLVGGLIAILPMLIYDFTIVKLLPGEFTKEHIFKSGWITNTFTNIGGFGGFLGASLRATFYGKSANHKEIVLAVSKIAIFLLSGLSIYSMMALGSFTFGDYGIVFRRYWPWLLGGSLYFPLVFIFTKIKSKTLFEDLPLSRELRLVFASLLEWGAAMSFFILIGYLLKEPVHLTEVFPIFVIASIVGIVSMVPGGVGTFDIFMIYGLGQIGVSKELAVIWLLFYRIFYYIIPFFIGILFFVHDGGSKINQYLDGLPKILLQKLAHVFLVSFVYFSGFMMIIISTVPNLAFDNPIFARLYPFTFFFLTQLSNVIFGFLLLGLARGIESKVKKAYLPTIIILGFGIINTLQKDFSWGLTIFLGIVLVAVYVSRHEFKRVKLTYSWGKILLDGVVIFGTLVLYIIIGYLNSPRFHHRKPVPHYFLFPSHTVWIAGFIGVIAGIASFMLILAYLRRSKEKIGTSFDETRLMRLLSQFGGNEVSHLVFLRDKRYYFYQEENEDQIVFQYREEADKLIIMGEPIGNQAFLEKAIVHFMDEANRFGFSLVFYEVSGSLVTILHELGYDFMKVGEEGHVNLPDFTISGKKRRAERALMNKLERENFHFSILEPPFTQDTFTELKAVSDNWLNHRQEKGFSLGFFDEYYLNQAAVAVVTNEAGNIVAFASMMPSGTDKLISIDLMRHHLVDAPPGVMDYLFVQLFESNRELGYESFNMGMAPLSKVGITRYSFLSERIAGVIYRYGTKFYGFQGLRKYKEKYVTNWIPKYVAFRKKSSILYTMLQLVIVVGKKKSLTNHSNDQIE